MSRKLKLKKPFAAPQLDSKKENKAKTHFEKEKLWQQLKLKRGESLTKGKMKGKCQKNSRKTLTKNPRGKKLLSVLHISLKLQGQGENI